MKPSFSKYDNLIFYSSISLIVIGGGLSTFVPYSLFFYYLPAIILFVGIVLIWFTNRKIRTKAIWTISPFLVFCAFWFIWYLDKKVDPEIFLLPDGYSGKVNIVYNQDCGQPEEWEGDSRVYRIPATGILLTQFQDEQGFIDHSYFFVDNTGKRTPITNLDVRDYNEEWTTVKNPNEPSRDSLGIFHEGRTYSDGTSEFYVSTYSDLIEKFGFQYERKFDSLKTQVIENCK